MNSQGRIAGRAMPVAAGFAVGLFLCGATVVSALLLLAHAPAGSLPSLWRAMWKWMHVAIAVSSIAAGLVTGRLCQRLPERAHGRQVAFAALVAAFCNTAFWIVMLHQVAFRVPWLLLADGAGVAAAYVAMMWLSGHSVRAD